MSFAGLDSKTSIERTCTVHNICADGQSTEFSRLHDLATEVQMYVMIIRSYLALSRMWCI